MPSTTRDRFASDHVIFAKPRDDLANHREHSARTNKKAPFKGLDLHNAFMDLLAERVGFEPTVRETRTLDFESSAFDHSATFPDSVSYLHRAVAQGSGRVYQSAFRSETRALKFPKDV